MQNDDPKDPLEGKGEEMVPDRGIPFDDIEESSLEETPPIKEDEQDSVTEGGTIPEEAAPFENLEPDPPSDDKSEETEALLVDDVEGDESRSQKSIFDEEIEEHYTPLVDDVESVEWTSEVQPVLLDEVTLSKEATPENETEIPFDVSSGDATIPESLTDPLSEVPHPWEMSDDEVDDFIGDAEAAFASPENFEASLLDGEMPSFAESHDYKEHPNALPDEGMGTALEESSYMGEPPPESMVLPEPGAMSGAPLFSEASFADPGPTSDLPGGTIPEQDEEQVAKDEMVEMLVTEDVLLHLWDRADVAQNQVMEQVNTLSIARQMLDHIQSARNELMGGPENYEEAERFVNEVDYRVSLSKKLAEWSIKHVVLIYIYETVWAVALLLLLTLYLGENAFASSQADGTSIMTYLVGSMIWGGFGGVIGAILSLVKHIAQAQDFDKQHTWWYINSPPIGIAMGAFIFLIMQGGLLSITGNVESITSPIVIYILAGLAGYQQNVFTDLIKRLMKVFEIQDSKEDEEKPPEIKSSKPEEVEEKEEIKEEAKDIPG